MQHKAKLQMYFVLTAVIALPGYILLGLTARGVFLTPDMAFGFLPLVTFAPLVAAAILLFQEGGWARVQQLLRRAFDFRRTERKIWFAIALVLPFLIVGVAWAIARFVGLDQLPVQAPFIAAPIMFMVFVIPALSEELGWMGYAYEPMKHKWGHRRAALFLGVAISAFHVPLYYFLIDDPMIVAVQILFPISLRLLVVWIYGRAGNSILAATIFHVAYNTSYSVLEVNIPVATLLSVICAIAVMYPAIGSRDHGLPDGR